jgi:trk system potassium uptake protein TrkA
MPSNSKKSDKEFAIIGLGRFGRSLARGLESFDHPVLGIDIDPQNVKAIADEIHEAVILDATDEDALREVDVTAFHTVIVAILRNFEANALITSTLKNLGIPNVISLSNTYSHRQILLRIGADRVILPEEESGNRLAEELSFPGVIDLIRLQQNFRMIEMKLPGQLVGKGVSDIEDYEVLVVLIQRGDELIINPDLNIRFLVDDILVLVGDKERLITFSNME